MHGPLATTFEDVGSERALLAAIVSYPDLLIEIDSQVEAIDFISPHNRAVYVVLNSLYISDGVSTFDVTSIITRANQLDLLDSCGGYDYIDSLFRTKVSKENVGVYLKAVIENSTKKALFDAVDNMRGEILNNVSGMSAKDSTSLISEVERAVLDVKSSSKASDDAVNIGEGIYDFLDTLKAIEGGVSGLRTGFDILDRRINGLTPGSLTILVARPKVGKSTMLMNWAKNLCYGQDIPKSLLYIDTEMSLKEVTTRMLSTLSGVKERLISTGAYKENEDYISRINKAAAVMEKGRFYHKYLPGATIEQVVSMAKKYYVKHQMDVLFYDYVKVADVGSMAQIKEHQMMGIIAAQLKDLAGELDIPVVTAAQIGRAGANTGYLKADMIADSDRLLRYCNNLLGLARKAPKEYEEFKDDKEAFSSYALQHGLHRLQILETRGGGTLFEGLNVSGYLETLTFKQSALQPPLATEGLDIKKDDFI